MVSRPSPIHSAVPLVGRSAECARLLEILQRARSGCGAMVIVSGEASIGKTLLVNQLRSVALTVSGGCYEFSATPPYGPWLEVLSELARHTPAPETEQPDVRPDLSGQIQDQHVIFTSIFRDLAEAASRQPIVAILEDLHWADTASIELLQRMSRQLHLLPVMIVVTYRDDELGRIGPLYRLLPNLLRDGNAERMRLRRIDLEGTNEIVARRYDLDRGDTLRLGSYLHSRAQGNPFFTTELLYALEEEKVIRQVNGKWQLAELDRLEHSHPLPELVRQLIEGRLARLSDLSVNLLRVAAVIGQDVPVSLWRTLTDIDEHEFGVGVERIVQTHFMRENADGRTLSFRHALVREAIYLSVVLPERQRLHRRAGEALLLDSEPDAERVASHFARAMDVRALEWLAIAAQRAIAVYDPFAAIEHCHLAFELAAALATGVPLDLYRTRGNAFAMVGEFAQAQRDLTTMLERSRAHDDALGEWQALQDLGQLWAARNYSRSREYFDMALETARRLQDDHRIGHSLNRVGNSLLNADQSREALGFHQQALEILKRDGDLLSVAQTTDLLGMDLLILGDHVSAGRVLREAIDGFAALDERIGLCSALGSFVTVAGSGGFEHEVPARAEPGEIERMMDQALVLARETHWRAGESFTLCVIGGHHLTRGNYREALWAHEQATSNAEDIGHHTWTAYALSNLADTHLSLLDPERARPYAERAIESAQEGSSRIHEKAARASLSRALMATGDVDAALAEIEQCFAPHGRAESSIDRFCRMVRAQAMLGANDPETALGIINQLIEETRPSDQQQAAPVLGRLRGEALTQTARYPDAETALVNARDFAVELEYRPDLWRILVSLGNLYTGWSRPGDARQAFAGARSIIEALAASVPDETLADHFRAAALARIPGSSGLSPFQAAKHESGGLTPRQREVAVLVARGWKNAAIADELSISERTVEGHVSAIMTTLDFSSRAQIAAWAVDQHLVTL